MRCIRPLDGGVMELPAPDRRLVIACATGMMLAAVLDGCEDRRKVPATLGEETVGLCGGIRRREWRKLWDSRGNVPAR